MVYSAEPSSAVAAIMVPTIRSGPISGTLDLRSVAVLTSAPSSSLHAIFAVVMLPPLSTNVGVKRGVSRVYKSSNRRCSNKRPGME